MGLYYRSVTFVFSAAGLCGTVKNATLNRRFLGVIDKDQGEPVGSELTIVRLDHAKLIGGGG